MTLQQFIDKWNGKGCDYDGSFGNQCQDLYRMYVKEVLGLPQTPPVVGAKDNWTVDTPNFEKIPNTPTGFPLPGDIVIWGATYGQFGHVAICTRADVNTFDCFSQNDPLGTLCGIRKYSSYKGVLGWMRAKNTGNIYKGYDLSNPDSMKVAVDALTDLISGDLVRKVEVAKLQEQFDSLKSSQESLAQTVESLRLSIGEKEKDIETITLDMQVLKNENQKLSEDLAYYKPYKSRYEDALNKVPNSLTSSQLFSLAWKKLWADRKLANKK